MMRQSISKQTPQKSLTNGQNNLNMLNELSDQSKQLLLLDPLATWFVNTPSKRQPQFLLSPSPIKKDLFHQLLGTQTKHPSPNNQQLIIEQVQITQDIDKDSHEINWDEDNGWTDENEIKKRKRKTSNQIKILKQEMGEQINWSKEKIFMMAQITGLSQSQVYKWCWDQKKKQSKSKEDSNKSFFQKRKNLRNQIYEDHSYFLETKIKTSNNIENSLNTQKKLTKKLFLN